MTELGMAALLLVPWLLGELVGRVEDARRSRLLALAASLSAFLIAAAFTCTFVARGATEPLEVSFPLFGAEHHGLHFIVDSLNATLLTLLTMLTLAIVVGAPAFQLSQRKLRALLRLEALTLLTLTSVDLLVLALGFCLVLLPIRQFAGRAAETAQRASLDRVFKLYHLLGLGSFLSATVLLAYHVGPSSFVDLNVLHLDISAVPERLQSVIFALFFLAALVRMGIVPLHSWLPASLEHGSLLAVGFLVSMRTGLYLLARLVIPAFPAATHAAIPLLTAVALISAMYGAIAAIGQHDLRRMVGFLVVSQSGIMLTGLILGDEHAISGTLLYWLGFAVATTGLVLMISALRARTGTSDMRQLGGLVGRVPHLSGHFFLFGLATIAIPGTLAFAAEDMLIHGVLEAHPLLTIVMILAMVLNAVSVVKAFANAFLGQPAPGRAPFEALEDLLPRERGASVALLIALICGGLYPQLLIHTQVAAAQHISNVVHPSAHAQR